jgi:hypothetical protein
VRPLIAAAALAWTASASAQDAPIDLTHARSYFAELQRLGMADAGKLWGVRLDGPMLFVDPSTRFVVANAPDSAGLLREQEGLWVGTLPPSEVMANTGVRWAGRRWAMVLWPAPDDRYARGRLLMHESFHRLQPSLGFDVVDAGNDHLSEADARIWMRLEMRALVEALLREGTGRREALRDALTFRAVRRQQFPNAARDEQRLEINEGLAEYTGLRLGGLPPTVLHDRAAIQLSTYEQRANFARSFAYATGPAYALLLDEADAGWRERLTLASDLADLSAVGFDVGDLDPASAAGLIERYLAGRMVAYERAQEAWRVAREQKYRQALVDGPTLRFPIADAFNYSFDPNEAVPIRGVGTAYETMRVSDRWGTLTVTSGGALLLRDDASITGIAVPAPIAGSDGMKGDGWAVELAPGWRLESGPRPGDWVVRPSP